MRELNQKQLERFRKLGLIDEIALRNHFIRNDFKQLKNERIKIDQILRDLAEKYNLSKSSVNMIVYAKKEHHPYTVPQL